MKKRNIVVYVSGKYSGDVGKNIVDAKLKAIELWNAGYSVICPQMNSAHLEHVCTLKYDQWIQSYVVILKRCDVIYMLPEWEESNGANVEHQEARLHNIPVCYSLEELNELSQQILEEMRDD